MNELFDIAYRPYFYFIPIGKSDLSGVFYNDGDKTVRPISIEKSPKTLLGKPVESVKVTVANASQVPKLSDAMKHLGDAYENDIPFAKRYSIDKSIAPLTMQRIKARKNEDGKLILESIEPTGSKEPIDLSVMCFDIEVYSPGVGMPKAETQPIIMISYSYKYKEKKKAGVITFKPINLPFVESLPDEKSMIKRFMEVLDELQPDIVTGYNSSGFDVKYFLEKVPGAQDEVQHEQIRGGHST